MFVQKIFFTTAKVEDIQKLLDEYDVATAPGNPSAWLLKDQDKRNAYVLSVAFDSAHEAKQNNARPETDAFAKRFRALCTGEPTYYNLDVISMS